MPQRIVCECLQSGQPRAYSDSFYVYRLRFEFEMKPGEYGPLTHRTEADAIAALRLFSRPFKAKDEASEWWERQLTGVEKESEGVFVLSLREAYTD